MKKSKKLLVLIIMVVALLCIFITNMVFKNRMEKQVKSKTEIGIDSTSVLPSSDSDSIAMEKAMENE